MDTNNRIPQHIFAKAKYLLPMAYKVRELSEELDVPISTLKGWLKSGIPHERDSRNHIYVYGPDVTKWVFGKRESKQKSTKGSKDYGFCFKCNQPVKMKNPKKKHTSGTVLLSGTCPICKTTVNKGVSNDQ